MYKLMKSAVLALSAASMLAMVPATARERDRGSDGRQWNRDRDGRASGWNGNDRGGKRWRNYGGNYGYNGYNGRWRSGQRFNGYRNNRYYVSNYGSYGLPAPRRGYRYYRDNNGDILLAAIGTGIIASILSNR